MTAIDTDLDLMRSGQTASALAHLIGPRLDAMDAAVDRRIMSHLASGAALDPNLAVQAWMEKHAIARLRKTLLAQESTGRKAAARLGTHFNPKED